MPLGKLRAQMLVAMGLPACWTGTAPPPVVETKPPVPVQRDFEAASCVRDSVPETVCGMRRTTARACGAKGSNLAAVDEFRLAVTTEDTETPEATYRDFVFDRDATQRYREDQESDQRGTRCCYSQCTAMIVGEPEAVTLSGGRSFGTQCMPAPPNGTSRPSKEDSACPQGVMIEGAMRPYVSTQEGECCYTVPRRVIIHSIPGRALRIDGVPHVAAVAERADWTAAIAPRVDLEPALRDRLAHAWLAIAQLEHASVAAFASLAMRLLAAGAPMSLIAAAHEAALDEVRHAQIAFALASAYAGTTLGPGAFESAKRAAINGDLRSIALETFADGCIGETAAAHQAELAAASTQDPELAAALAVIADDEARHGALAWSIVAWCVREGAVTVSELREIAATAEAPLVEEDAELAVHGVIGDGTAARLRSDVLRDVVLPCLHALAA